jgi:beta-1,4-mannosyl-glycoprotein beta-1,4-N-acetylglucosaminyltransferase
MFVIDTFCFNGEWVVPMRLEYLNDVVDAFVIVESYWTHSGIRKVELFKDRYADWFLPYSHKIHWIVVETFPEMTEEWAARYRSHTWMLNHQAHWFREAYQRDIAGDYIADAFRSQPSAIVHVSDADEIPRIDVFRPDILEFDAPIYLEQAFYYYNFHWKKPTPWMRAYVVPGRLLHRPDSGVASFTHWRVCPSESSYILSNAGWHFSYFMTVPELQQKLAAFAHRECDNPQWNSEDHIRRCLTEGFDLFGRVGEPLIYTEPVGFPPLFMVYKERLNERQLIV